MVRLLVFSDNHRERSGLKEMLRQNHGYDHVFSLGDSEMPEHELSSMGIVGVRGNYPFEPQFPYDLNLRFLDYNVFFTHGHRYFVKSGLSALYRNARSLGCQIAFYGHTHIWNIEDAGDVLLVNPGSLAYPKLNSELTYAVVELLKNQVAVSIVDVTTQETIKNYIKYYDSR